MKRIIYKALYSCTLALSNRMSSRLLSKFKMILGTALLLLMSSGSCSKEDEPEVTCYDTAPTCYIAPPQQETAKTEIVNPPATARTEIVTPPATKRTEIVTPP